MKQISARAAFTLVETMISATASIIMIGSLLLSCLSLQKSIHGSEVYAGCYADQRRLIDYLARDLRRCIGMAATEVPGGAPRVVSGETITVTSQASLILDLPGYYQSNDPNSGNYTQTLPVVVADGQPTYGEPSGPTKPVRVIYRQIFVGSEGCVCFVRQEGPASEPILRNAENLHLQTTIAADGTNGVIKVWYYAPYSATPPLVTTCEQIMLRNPRLDLSP